MNKLAGLVVVLIVSSGCSALLLPGQHGPYRSPRTRANADPYAAAIGRWDQVMRLPHTAIVDILTRDGMARVGAFTAADEESVRVEIQGIAVRVPRRDVVRIDLVDLPGADAVAVAKGAGGGALMGAALMGLFSAALGGDAWPPSGTALRTGALLGGLVGGESAMQGRRGRPIYIKPNP
jgi:hypothetical protein